MEPRGPLSPHATRLASPVVAGKILAVISGRVPETEVDDLVQGTYLRALLLPDPPDDMTRLLWLVATIARGLVVDFYRRRGRDAQHLLDDRDPDDAPVDDAPSSARDPVEAREALTWIEREVEGGKLPEEVLRWSRELAAGVTCEEIASREGKSASAVKVAMHRARKLLYKRWRAYVAAATLSVLLVALFYALRGPRTERIVAVPEERGPRPAPTPSAPTAVEQARALRDDAFRACDAQKWQLCLRHLDEAKDRDPAGDTDPRVQASRKQASDALANPQNPPRDGKDLKR